MGNTGILVIGVLVVVAVLVVSAVIVALAPYLAVGVVVFAICWYLMGKNDTNSTSVESEEAIVPTKKDPRE